MEVSVHYSEEEATPFQQSFFVRVAEETLKRCPLPSLLRRKRLSFNAVAVSAERIQELNRTYCGKDKVTDILSFGEYADRAAFEADQEEEVFLGEIFFCQEFIAGSAREDGVTLAHELVYVFSHGVLHLLGYDHEEEMFTLQDEVTEFLAREQKTNNQ